MATCRLDPFRELSLVTKGLILFVIYVSDGILLLCLSRCTKGALHVYSPSYKSIVRSVHGLSLEFDALPYSLHSLIDLRREADGLQCAGTSR